MTVLDKPARMSVNEPHLAEMVRLSRKLAGHLTDREVRFLALATSLLPPYLGEVLEIGSFKGKSTTILAKSVELAGGFGMSAVDPLTLPSSTDPIDDTAGRLADVFYSTLESNGVREIVEFHQMKSEQLAAHWDRPLRLLWIDGDHTYEGAVKDFDGFAKHLQPGSLIAFHDVLHRSEGALRAFCERVLLSPDFGPCGVCGSIGWSQRMASSRASKPYHSQKLRLYRRLSRLIPFVAFGNTPRGVGHMAYNIGRWFVPHGGVAPSAWANMIVKNIGPAGEE